jgi:hypothetical protein
MNRKVRAGSIPASSTKVKKLYIYIKMKKVLFIAALVTLAACSNSTSTTSKDSTCKDSVCKDSVCTDSIAKDSLIKK